MHVRLVGSQLNKNRLSPYKKTNCAPFIMLWLLCMQYGYAQDNAVLHLSEAVKNGLNSYQSIKAALANPVKSLRSE